MRSLLRKKGYKYNSYYGNSCISIFCRSSSRRSQRKYLCSSVPGLVPCHGLPLINRFILFRGGNGSGFFPSAILLQAARTPQRKVRMTRIISIARKSSSFSGRPRLATTPFPHWHDCSTAAADNSFEPFGPQIERRAFFGFVAMGDVVGERNPALGQ